MLYWSRRGGKSLGRSRYNSASTKWYRSFRGWRMGRALVSGLVGLGLLFAPPIMGQPAVVELLQTLNLSDYRPDMRLPPFTGQTATGEEVSLAALQGRVVLVNFWASWCAECRPEMPMFERLHRDFATQGLTVLGINFREDMPRIQGYAKELNLTFPLLLDPGGEIFRSYGVIGLPTTFLVGRDGRPVAMAIGARAWGSAEARALIQGLLAESVAK